MYVIFRMVPAVLRGTTCEMQRGLPNMRNKLTIETPLSAL
jgi:hypothetical protein